MNIKIINQSNNPLPNFKTDGSAGMDVRAFLKSTIVLKPMERMLIPTGLYMEIPRGYEAQVRPRSGLALKNGITCLNAPGTIDSDYRGEIGVILVNLSLENFAINSGDRIAQIVFAKHESPSFIEVENLEDTDRGQGGFGSTGV